MRPQNSLMMRAKLAGCRVFRRSMKKVTQEGEMSVRTVKDSEDSLGG